MSTMLEVMGVPDFIARNINTIEGLPRSGRGYLVTDIKYEIDAVPVIEVEMAPDAFRTAIGYLNHVPFGMWSSPTNKKKKPIIEKVIYNPPATIVWFDTGSKVVSKVEEGDEFDWEKGLALCVLKEKMNKKTYHRLFPYFDACELIYKKDKNGDPIHNIVDGKEAGILIDKAVPLWDVLVRMECPNGEWEKIKKKWRQK